MRNDGRRKADMTGGRRARDPFRQYPMRLRQALEVAAAIIRRMSARRLDSMRSGA